MVFPGNGGEEWGKAKADIEHTRETVEKIETLLLSSIDKNEVEHDVLHERIGNTNKAINGVKLTVAKLIGGLILLATLGTIAVSVWSILK